MFPQKKTRIQVQVGRVGRVGGDPRGTGKSDRKGSDPVKDMCVPKPVATVDTQSSILPGNL